MTSLTDVYHRRTGTLVSQTRLLAGVTLFALGASLTGAGVVVATTGVGSLVGLGTYGARELAGVLAGLGLPATFVGILAVLPTNRTTRAGAAIGTGLSVFAVALFTHVYPMQWPGAPAVDPLLSLVTLSTYFVGTITTGWCLFVAAARFKTRKSPGGTAEMHVTEEGRIELVRDTDDGGPSVGGVGLFGNDPDGEVPTQTGQRSGMGDRPASTRTASDGGSTTADPGDAESGFVSAASGRGRPDRYCGNCKHFHYVRVDEAIEPYCDHHERYMDDIDACEAWSSNNRDRPA